MYRGGGGLTGFYAEKVVLPLSLDWKYTASIAPHNPSSPAVVGKDIFYAAGSRIYCLDAESGSLKWRYPQDQPLSSTIFASPAVADGMVYFGAGDGKLYALQASNGNYAWAYDTKSNIANSPTIVDGIVYFGSSDGKVWAIDSKTHDSVPTWRGGVKTSDEITGAPAVANGMVYALSLDQQLHAIGTATGKERYVTRVPASVLRMAPVTVGDYVYIANGANISCYMARNLNQKWFLPMPTDLAVPPAANDQNVFVVTTDGMVYALEGRTGKMKWRTAKKLDYNVSAPPTIAGNTILLGTGEGAVLALDADNGAVKWTYRVQPSTNSTDQIVSSTSIDAAPVVANGTVYIVTDDGTLSAFRNDASDSTAPIISDMEPAAGQIANGEPPLHFEAKIIDEGSGVDPESIRIAIDGEGAARRPAGEAGEDKSGYRFDVYTDFLEYDILAPVGASVVRPLANGRHTVTISAADWRGNVATKSWTFTVDNSIARRLNKPKRAAQNQRNGIGGPGSGGPGSGSGRPGGGKLGGGGGSGPPGAGG
jgi:outer membrane protein assembly factor BamB